MAVDAWRIINLTLAIVAALLLCRRLRVSWRTLTPTTRQVGVAHLVLLSYVAVSAVESLTQHDPYGVRTGVATVACLWTALACFVPRQE